jgi:pyrimidine-nucleoside phosphorylase
MTITSLIRRKREGEELSDEEIARVVSGAADGTVPDYQLSALMMAIYFRGMTPGETATLTAAMTRSGSRLDLSNLSIRAVDKHSTGGVGDKVSLILAPIVASAGLAVPMISGRGLGHTGGTVDKLESIPGMRVELSLREIERLVGEIGIAMGAQSDELAPADRRLYAIRDVTATVESIPLITASILSKKLAEDLDALVMDIKCGPGAFMKNEREARALASSIEQVAALNGLACRSFVTRMDRPLGRRVGNWLEVCDSARVLRGEEEPPALLEVTLALAGACIHAGGSCNSLEEGIERARRSIADGSAYALFLEMIRRQGGRVDSVERSIEPKPDIVVRAGRSGYVRRIDPLAVGLLAIELGAGRRTLDDPIDPEAGIVIERHVGEFVEKGEPLCSLVNRRAGTMPDVAVAAAAFEIGDAPAESVAMILE